MYKLAELKRKLEDLKIHPKKTLGQNFLIHQIPIDRAVDILDEYPKTDVIEIGPGLGALTEEILTKAHNLTVIELDRVFAQIWRERGVKTIEEDALRVDWAEILLKPSVLISNLPYQISAPLVIDRSIEPYCLQAMILMFQKEVAERIQAKEKTETYGMLSVIAQTFWQIEFVIDAGPKDFYPPPKIASRILWFKKREDLNFDRKKFLTFVKQAFAQRRKLLKKNLSSYPNVLASMQGLAISEQARAEDLSPSQYVALFERIYND